MADDETLDDKINKIFADKFRKELSDTEKRLAKLIPDKKTFKSLYTSDKTGRRVGGTALLNKLLKEEKTLLSLRIDSVKKKTENLKKVADAENKLQKEIIKDIKIEQNNRKKQTFINNALQKDSIKRNYKASAWLSNVFKNIPINRNLQAGQRPPIQNNKNTPFITDMLGINTPQMNMMGKLANKPINSNDALQFAINSGNGGINFNALANVPLSKFTNIAGVHQGKFINKSTTGIHTVPTQKQSGKNNILTQSLKTHNTKKTNDIKSLVSWLLNNNVKQDTIDNLMYDQNGKLLPLVDMENILKQEKLNVIALQNLGKPVSQSYEDMSIKDKILYNKDKNRKILLNKYGQGIAKKDPDLFDSITSSGDDKQILNVLENMYNAEKAQIQMAKDAEKARKDAEKAQRKADIEERRNKALEQKNLREQQKLLKQQQRLLEQEQKERKKFFKDLMSAPKPFNISRTASSFGYGGLGLAGAGAGGLLGGVGGLIPSLLTGAVGGATSLLGGGASLLGAGLGIKGLSKVGGFLSKGGANTLKDAGKYTRFSKTGGKLGARIGAGATKLGGKASIGLARGVGGLFGKIPGIGMFTKIVPGLNTILAAGAIGYGIYDAWNSTNNTMDFLKESAWNTGGNLISMATMGIIDADEAKAFGKDMAGKVQNSQMYKDAKERAEKYIKGSRPYKTFFSDDDPNIRILENARKRYEKDNPKGSVESWNDSFFGNFIKVSKDKPGSYEKSWNNSWLGNFIKLSEDIPKKISKESLPDYFWNNRTALKSKNNLLIPSWVKDTRGQLTDNFKNMKLGGDLFNMGSTNSVRNSNTTTNNNSVVNVYNEPQQNKTTPVMAFGGNPRAVLGF